MQRRILTLLLIISLFAVPFLSACSKNNNSNQVSNEGSKANTKESVGTTKSMVTPLGEFPITTEKVTLTVMIPSNTGVDWETNGFTLWYEEKTNVHLEFEEVPAEGRDQALNLRLASNDLPDLIIGFDVSAAQQQIYGEQGVFLPLENLIDELGFYINDLFEYDVTAKSTITTPNKNIFTMPNTSDCYHCQFAQKMWIYKPWLDQLNLPVPTTTDEFYNTLKAFKANFPGAIPLVTMPDNWNTAIDAFLMNSFVYNDHLVNKWMWLNNGKVDTSYTQPGFREGLAYLNKLYTEGLLAPESFTQDQASLLAMVGNPNHIVGAVPGGYAGIFADLSGDKWYNYIAVPPLKGPSGVQIAAWNPFLTPSSGRLLINSNTKYPEIAFRWADGLYQDEVFQRQKYGLPEVDYTFNVDGKKGIDGGPAVWEELIPWGLEQNNHWNQTAPIFETGKWRLGKAVIKDPMKDLEPVLYEASKKMEPHKIALDKIVPPLFFSDEQTAELTDLKKTIDDYVGEMIARFTLGTVKNNDEEWQKYLDTLEGMNLKKMLEIYQAAYDSKYGQ